MHTSHQVQQRARPHGIMHHNNQTITAAYASQQDGCWSMQSSCYPARCPSLYSPEGLFQQAAGPITASAAPCAIILALSECTLCLSVHKRGTNLRLCPCLQIASWWDYGYQTTAMANRTVLVDNNTWNNTHIATVGRAMASPEKQAWTTFKALDTKYVLVVFGGFIG